MHEARNAAAWALLALTGMNQLELPTATAQIINGTVQNDTYFYGESPPVYPSPIGSGNATAAWTSSYAKAAALVAQMTTNEKVNLTGGISDPSTGCSGVITNITRIGFPGLCLNDAGNGVRGTDFVNGYPAGLSVGASWNRVLANERAAHMGLEFRIKGVNIALGPVVGPLGRIVKSGRNWEGFANDPYLSGQLAYSHIQGVQSQGVITSVKHYIGNEQETNRNPTTDANGTNIESSSSNIDDQTIHELYLWPFQDAVLAGTGNVMCSYNRLNNSHGCQNSKSLNGLLKTELGYEGFVVSDWGAQHSGVASALAGLDMTMPNPSTFWGDELVAAVANGSVPESRLDDMATRIIATWYQLGQDEGFPALGVGMPADYTKPHPIVDARDPTSQSIILNGAIEGHVLVKNINNSLPLVKPKMLSLFGYDAKTPDLVGIASLDQWLFGQEEYATGASNLFALSGTTPNTTIANLGVQIMGGGSGAVTPAYWNSPYDSLSQRAYTDGTYLQWDFITPNSETLVDPASDACLVFINAWAAEGNDRFDISDSFSDDLVTNVASQCNNTIVVIHNAGARLVDAFADNPNVTAIVYAHTPGQDAGRSITALLYGDENFSGKMPYTVAKNSSDYGLLLSPAQPDGLFALFPQANFTEGVYIDYRAFDALNMTPQYEFGFGLSYTTFNYTDLNIAHLSPANTGSYPVGPIQAGGAADLWDRFAVINANITNTGSVTGQEVSQLYVGIPNGPIRQLRGFDKKALNASESYTVEFNLTRRDLSYWDTAAQQWNLQSGAYQIYVGGSSRSLPLTGTLNIS